MKKYLIRLIVISILSAGVALSGDGFNIAIKNVGLSFGNSKYFTGVRINIRDNNVKRITGVNVTLLPAKNTDKAVINGISIGVSPSASTMTGLNIGLLGVGTENDLNGISLGIAGAGAGGSINGVILGGFGAGAGENITGFGFGTFGLGAGNNFTGIGIGGLGVGAGNDFKGIGIGGLGIGAGNDFTGLAFGLMGAGVGHDFKGIGISGLGIGAGHDFTGIGIAGLGLGAGNKVSGIVFAGLGVGSIHLKGIILSLCTVRVEEDGTLTGFAAAAYTKISGTQNGVTLGIVNVTDKLNGMQFGLINIVKENPKPFRVLPILNFHF